MIHSFDVDIAKKYGVNAAIILQNLYYWINKNKANEKHFHDGYYWTYNSVKAFEAMFPYMGKKQITYALDKLEDDEIIVTGNYNDSSYDRTKWYAITQKGYKLFGVRCSVSSESNSPKEEIHFPKGEMDSPKGGMTFPKREQPIPDNKPNNKPDNKPNNNISISSDENIDIVGSAPTEPKRENLKHEQIKRDFNATCQDLPVVKAMSETRKRDIRTLLNEFEKLKILDGLTPYEKLHRIFLMVQDSDFLSGRNGKWNKCSFDWIINKRNALKILEGNYANKADNGIPTEKKSAEKGAVQKEQENPEEEEEVGDDW